MSKLVVPSHGQLQRDSKGFHGHNRYRSNCRTDRYVYQWILLAVLWCDFVDHDAGKYGDRSAVKEERFQNLSFAQGSKSGTLTWMNRIL